MPAISPKLGEFLIKITQSKSIDDAFHTVFTDYLELKIRNLQEISEKFQKKWGMNFKEFNRSLKKETLKDDAYSFNVENDFWQWEEAETLREHYEKIRKQWI